MRARSIAVLAVLIGSSLPVFASTLPTLATDGISVDLSDPHIGALVLAIPGSAWTVWFEDTIGLGDQDFNDSVARIQFLSAGPQLTPLGGITSTRAVLEAPYFAGAEAIVTLDVLSSGWVWHSGPGERNADGLPHAFVIEATPEPTGAELVCPAIIAILAARRWNGRILLGASRRG